MRRRSPELREMGVSLIPVEMPKFPYQSMVAMLSAEAAAAFDDLIRSRQGQTAYLTEGV